MTGTVKMPLKKTLSHNWYMIKLLFSASPFYGTMQIVESVRRHLFNFFEHTIGIGFVLETVEFGRDFGDILRFMLLMLGLLALSALFSSFFNGYVMYASRLKVDQKLKLKLYQKAKDLDLSCYDDPYYYNEFVLATTESKNALDRTAELIQMVFTGIVMFLSYGIFFLIKDPISVLFVLASFAGRVLIGVAANKLNFRAKIAETPFVRKRSYIHRVFYLNDYAKELRLNKDASKGLYRDFENTNGEIFRIRKGVSKKKWALEFLGEYLLNDFIANVIYLTYLVFKTVVQKAISFSSMFVLYNSLWGLRQGMNVLSDLFPYAVETALYVEKIRTFLDYETSISDTKRLPVPAKPATICFEDVSFRYTETQEFILSHINLTIYPKDTIALVGYNGAGKTTLVKLLMRLYDPTDGRITLDGVDIRDYSLDEYRDRIGTIFQDYRIYAASVEENIVMDLQGAETNMGVMERALDLSGFDPRLREMKDGLATPLTREFDEAGTALSGGESQKLATARVFYKSSDVIILDEPSSALDPIAEYQLNHSMSEAARDKSVVFISHRLSTTKHAGKIFMLERGRIIEEGTHEQLLQLNGKYKEMWIAQASKYVSAM